MTLSRLSDALPIMIPALKINCIYRRRKRAGISGIGSSALGQFINTNLIEANLDATVDCNVRIKMIVDSTGEIKKAVPIQGNAEVKEPNANEKEVLRVYLKSGIWVPAKCSGNNVTAEFVQSFTPCIKQLKKESS